MLATLRRHICALRTCAFGAALLFFLYTNKIVTHDLYKYIYCIFFSVLFSCCTFLLSKREFTSNFAREIFLNARRKKKTLCSLLELDYLVRISSGRGILMRACQRDVGWEGPGLENSRCENKRRGDAEGRRRRQKGKRKERRGICGARGSTRVNSFMAKNQTNDVVSLGGCQGTGLQRPPTASLSLLGHSRRT